jgi:hypothetical protein
MTAPTIDGSLDLFSGAIKSKAAPTASTVSRTIFKERFDDYVCHGVGVPADEINLIVRKVFGFRP